MTDPIRIENRASLNEGDFARIVGTVARHTSIKHAIDWSLGLSPPVVPVDAVAQDEFSHDILFPLHDGTWLIYDCT